MARQSTRQIRTLVPLHRDRRERRDPFSALSMRGHSSINRGPSPIHRIEKQRTTPNRCAPPRSDTIQSPPTSVTYSCTKKTWHAVYDRRTSAQSRRCLRNRSERFAQARAPWTFRTSEIRPRIRVPRRARPARAIATAGETEVNGAHDDFFVVFWLPNSFRGLSAR